MMATLIKIGKTVVNLDNVTSIVDMGSRMRLYFSAASTEDGLSDYTQVNDDDAVTLRAWLDWQARDIAAELEGRHALVLEAPLMAGDILPSYEMVKALIGDDEDERLADFD